MKQPLTDAKYIIKMALKKRMLEVRISQAESQTIAQPKWLSLGRPDTRTTLFA